MLNKATVAKDVIAERDTGHKKPRMRNEERRERRLIWNELEPSALPAAYPQQPR